MLAEKGDLPLTKETRVIYWAKGSRLNLTNDSVGPYHLQLNNLKPYTTYNAVVVLRATDKIRQTVPHIPEYLRISEKIMFTTKVEGE